MDPKKNKTRLELKPSIEKIFLIVFNLMYILHFETRLI